jgi:hypothetical protein
MATITADDIRVLAQSNAEDPVLVLVDGDPRVLPGADAEPADIIYTKLALVEEFGEDITDVEAEILAGGLTNKLT